MQQNCLFNSLSEVEERQVDVNLLFKSNQELSIFLKDTFDAFFKII